MSLLPRILVFSPTGCREPGIVVGASRAGALGVLDFGFTDSFNRIKEAVRNVGRLIGDRSFGLRLRADLLHEDLVRSFPPSLRVLVVTGPLGQRVDWSGIQGSPVGSELLMVAEVHSREAALEAAEAGVPALIIAGHEAGGVGADDSSLILLQAVLERTKVPVWVRGGIGARSASACVAGGASGVVLDGAVLLARETPLESGVRERLARWDGGETSVIGPGGGSSVRVHASPGSPALARLKASAEAGEEAWLSAIRDEVGWDARQVWPVGQDAALAVGLARRHVTVGGIVQHVERSIDEGLKAAWSAMLLAEGSRLLAVARHEIPDRPGADDASE